MLGFWPSDAVLLAVQASLVCGPRPGLPAPLRRLRSGAWAWLLLPVSLGGTIALLALVPGLGLAYAWTATIGVPLLAAIAIGWSVPGRPVLRVLAGLLAAVLLLAIAWADHASLLGQGAAVALTALSCCTLGAWLGALAPVRVLKAGLVAMAVLDAVLVFGQLLEGPDDTLNAATPGAHLPHLQLAVFGSVLMGYGDLFVAAVLGSVVAVDASVRWPPRWAVALVVLACAAVFDLLFLVTDDLPATVPVAVALVAVNEVLRRAGAQGRIRRGRP